MLKAALIILALAGGMVVHSTRTTAKTAMILRVKPTGDRSVTSDNLEERSTSETMEMNAIGHNSGVSDWTSSDSDYTDPSSPISPDYGVKSYYGESDENNFAPSMNNMDAELDPVVYYHPGPPPRPHRHFYRRRRPRPNPRNLLRLLQSTLSSQASRNLKSFQSALKSLGVTAAPPPTDIPETTPTSNPQPNSEIVTTSPPKPASNPAVELIVQLAPTLTKLVDSVGNAVGGEGSLLALKRDSILARLKYKKALFIGLPESLIMAKLNLPNTLINGKKALLGVVSSLAAPPPSMDMMMIPSPESVTVTPAVSDPGSDLAMSNALAQDPSSSTTVIPETSSPVNIGNPERLADKVSITYQDLEPVSSQIWFHSPSPPTPFFNLQRPHYWRSPLQYYNYSNNRFRHPIKQRRRRLMHAFD